MYVPQEIIDHILLFIKRSNKRIVEKRLEKILQFPEQLDERISYTSRYTFVVQDEKIKCILESNTKDNFFAIKTLYEWYFTQDFEEITADPLGHEYILIRSKKDDGAWEPFLEKYGR